MSDIFDEGVEMDSEEVEGDDNASEDEAPVETAEASDEDEVK